MQVNKPRLRRAILALRDNPRLQAIMTAERLEQGRTLLERHLGMRLMRLIFISFTYSVQPAQRTS